MGKRSDSTSSCLIPSDPGEFQNRPLPTGGIKLLFLVNSTNQNRAVYDRLRLDTDCSQPKGRTLTSAVDDDVDSGHRRGGCSKPSQFVVREIR